MIQWVKKWFPEILLFGVILAVLMIDLNPDYTFMNKAADSIGYMYSAKYLYPSYHTSAPLYLLSGHVFLQLPFGTDAWRMGLISVISTMIACVFLYLTIRHMLKENKNARWYSLLGVLAYGTSALVLSQSIIVNTYALTTMTAIGAYYFAIKQQWKRMAVMLGLGLAVHLLAFIVAFIMFVFIKGYRKNWKALAITASFVLMYLYVPITNRPPYMWLPNPAETNSFMGVIADTLSVINMLVGTISVWDIPKKILDTVGLVGLSIGVITIVPLIYYIKSQGKKILYYALLWLAFAPTILFIAELDMNTYDYVMVGIPFMLIMAVWGLSMMVERFKFGKRFAYASLAVIVGLGAYNVNFFDIGRTLDSNMSASKLYYEEFAKIPDGAVFMPNGGWNWEAIYKYNRDNDKQIYPICIDILPSESYQEQLKKDGIRLVSSKDPNLSIQSNTMAKSIIELNDNIWTTVYTDPKTFGAEVVEANHDTSLIPELDMALIKKNEKSPDLKWMPDSPYKIITTELFLTRWSYVVYSRYNLRLFALLFGGIYAMLVFVPKIWQRRRRDEISRHVISEKTQDNK